MQKQRQKLINSPSSLCSEAILPVSTLTAACRHCRPPQVAVINRLSLLTWGGEYSNCKQLHVIDKDSSRGLLADVGYPTVHAVCCDKCDRNKHESIQCSGKTANHRLPKLALCDLILQKLLYTLQFQTPCISPYMQLLHFSFNHCRDQHQHQIIKDVSAGK